MKNNKQLREKSVLWKQLSKGDRARKSSQCDNCGENLSSFQPEVRGFVLCEVCREVEEEISNLGEEQYWLRGMLVETQELYRLTHRLCLAGKMKWIRTREESVSRDIDELLKEWIRLGSLNDSLMDD